MERDKPSTIHVGHMTGYVRRKQKTLVSIDEEGRVSFRAVDDDKPAHLPQTESPDED